MDTEKREKRKKRLLEQRRKKVKKQRMILGSLSAAAVAIVIILVVAIGNFSNKLSTEEAEAAAKRAANEQSEVQMQAVSTESTTEVTVTATPTPTETPTPTPTEEPTPEPTPIPDDGTGTTIRICMVGDLLLHDSINQTCYTGDGYDYSGLFANTSYRLADYDIKLINEETACGGEAYGITGYPSFNSPTSAIDAIVNAGFNVACLATNHMLDYGTGPLMSTLDYWHTYYPQVGTIGAYGSEEASEDIYVYEKDGFRVAILNYAYGSNAGTGEDYDAPYALNLLNEDEVYADIQRAKEISDYVIVVPHWGTEDNLGIDDYQEYWACLLNEWGVDLVIGAHPHVIEPMEVKTSSTGYNTIIYYSLGNFVSNPSSVNRMIGAMADITIRKNESGVHVDDFGAIPLITHYGGGYGYTTFYWSEYPEDYYYASAGYALDPNFTYEYCTNVIYSEFGDRVRA